MCYGRSNGGIIASTISVLGHLCPHNFIKLGLDIFVLICYRRQYQILLGVPGNYLIVDQHLALNGVVYTGRHFSVVAVTLGPFM
jgi:hypothetical protein